MGGNLKQLALVLLMAVVTFIPRILPFYFFKNKAEKHPESSYAGRLFGRSLSLIPYAALGALIFPGVLIGKGAFSYAAAAGASAAVITSLLGGGLVPSVITSVAAAFAVLLLTGV